MAYQIPTTFARTIATYQKLNANFKYLVDIANNDMVKKTDGAVEGTADKWVIRDGTGAIIGTKFIGDVQGNADTATLADAAKGDTRFQISGNFYSNLSIGASLSTTVQSVCRLIPPGKRLFLKKVGFFINNSGKIKILVDEDFVTQGSFLSQSYKGEETPNQVLAIGSDNVKRIDISIYNSTGSSINVFEGGWWLDLSIE